jgi:putative endonuclease
MFGGYTSTRRPVALVYSEWFQQITEIASERQIKGWSRLKKEALIRGDFAALRELSKRSTKLDTVDAEACGHPSRRVAPQRSSG